MPQILHIMFVVNSLIKKIRVNTFVTYTRAHAKHFLTAGSFEFIKFPKRKKRKKESFDFSFSLHFTTNKVFEATKFKNVKVERVKLVARFFFLSKVHRSSKIEDSSVMIYLWPLNL